MKRTGVPRSVTSGAQASTVATTIPFATGQWQTLRASDILLNTSTNEQVFVSETPSGSGTVNVTVTRGFASTTPAAITDQDTWLRLGNAQSEWSSSPDLIGTDPTTSSNYVQQIRHPFGASGRAIAIGKAGGNIGPDEMEWLREDTFRDHQEAKERTLLWGVQSLNGTRTTTDGLISQISAAGSGAAYKDWAALKPTQDRLDLYLYDMFKYSAKDKMALCGSEFPTYVRGLAYGKLVVDNQESTKYGLRISTYRSPHGDVQFMHHPYFEAFGLSKSAFFFEPECVTLRGIRGRMDTVLDTGPGGNGIQANDVDGTIYQYMCEIGLQVTNLERCGYMEGFDADKSSDGA
jgi:hypothetical protein